MWEEKTFLKLPWAFAGISCSLSTRRWVYASKSNLQQLSTWQGLESPQRQTSFWVQLAYFVSQAEILTSSISWLRVLQENFVVFSLLRASGGGKETYAKEAVLEWLGAIQPHSFCQDSTLRPQLTQQIWENTLAVDPEEELERHWWALKTTPMFSSVRVKANPHLNSILNHCVWACWQGDFWTGLS